MQEAIVLKAMLTHAAFAQTSIVITMASIALTLCLVPALAWAGNITDTNESQDTPTTTTKAQNPMTVKAKSSKIAVRYALVKKSNQTIKKAKAFAISDAKGKVTFKKKSGSSKITVASNGNITVKKGLKAGTYKVKVQVKASGNANYKPKTTSVLLKIWLRGDIKGNISYTTGEKIYHLPGDKYYKDTIIDESEGERWFVTESQARKAGWRHTYI